MITGQLVTFHHGDDMTRQQATNIVSALNAIAPYVPPLVFSTLANSDGMALIMSVANGQTKLSIDSPVQDAEKLQQAQQNNDGC